MGVVGTRLLEMEIGSESVEAEISKAAITSGESDSDFVTFAEAAEGGKRDYTLAMTALQKISGSSIWMKIWSAAGSTVACVYKPFGNEIPTVDEPHFTFNAIVREPDGDLLGGEANASATARQIIEVEWPLTAKPVMVTTPGD